MNRILRFRQLVYYEIEEAFMNNIIEKLGSYQIMTNLLPGAFFGVGLSFFYEL